jgi:hypothetical protein
MFLNIVTKKHVWKYYTKLSDFTAQCKFCEKEYYYIKVANFERHTRKHEEIWKYEEERKLTKWPWMYFKYFNKLYLQCIICDAKVLSATKSVENHLSSHSKKQQENHILRRWQWKYFTKRGDFVMECNICHKYLSLSVVNYLDRHIKKTHSNKLTNTQETCDTFGSSERVLSLQTDTIPMSLNDCSMSDMSNFWVHIKKMHEKVFNLEEKFRSLHGSSRIYFKYFNSLALKCIICDESVLFLSECLEDHLRSHTQKQ